MGSPTDRVQILFSTVGCTSTDHFFIPTEAITNSMSQNGIRTAFFCHNVKAQPHLDWTDKSWNTEVAELGIACGACHGPAGEHAQRALSPVTRYLWHLKSPGAPPVAVTNPAKLDSDRSAMVCGHCHGQRVPEPRDRIRTMMSDGDPYDAGKNLLEFYRPVQREDKIGSFSFASRFWVTARLASLPMSIRE